MTTNNTENSCCAHLHVEQYTIPVGNRGAVKDAWRCVLCQNPFRPIPIVKSVGGPNPVLDEIPEAVCLQPPLADALQEQGEPPKFDAYSTLVRLCDAARTDNRKVIIEICAQVLENGRKLQPPSTVSTEPEHGMDTDAFVEWRDKDTLFDKYRTIAKLQKQIVELGKLVDDACNKGETVCKQRDELQQKIDRMIEANEWLMQDKNKTIGELESQLEDWRLREQLRITGKL